MRYMLVIYVIHRICSPNLFTQLSQLVLYIYLSTVSPHADDFTFTATLQIYVKIFIANLNKNLMSQDVQ